jgi:hypothetical protein
VLIAQGSQSLPATNATQFYVSLSRARNAGQAIIFTDDSHALKRKIARDDTKLTAREVIGKPRSLRSRLRTRWLQWMRTSLHRRGPIRHFIPVPKEIVHAAPSRPGYAR